MFRIAALIGSLFVGGCAPDAGMCSAIGCDDGISLVVSAAGDAGTGGLPIGEYMVLVEVAGLHGTTTCTVSTTESHCTGDANMAFVGLDSKIWIFLKVTPPSISVTVTRGGAELASQTVAPVFYDNKPNGPDCEPTCKQSKVTIAVPI